MDTRPEINELYATARGLWLSDQLTSRRLAEESGDREDLLTGLAEHAEDVYLNDQIFLAGEIAELARAALGKRPDPLF